jgi:Fic family protein
MNITRYIKHSNLIEGVADPEEIPKSIKAWEFLCTCDKLTEEIILNVHTIVMTELLTSEYVGTYRVHDVFVGEYKAPGPFIVPFLMADWVIDMEYYQDLDPKIKHIEFERIHPFKDGNGRVGRLLMWWHEMKLDGEPTLITYNKRFDYYNWFESEYK